MIEQRTLEIRGDSKSIADFLDDLTSRLADGWRRDAVDEERLKHTRNRTTVFLTPGGYSPEAAIYLTRNQEGTECRVTNVLPPYPTTGSIPDEKKNEIIEEFYKKYIQGLTSAFGLLVELAPGQFSLEDLAKNGTLSDENANYLRVLAGGATAHGGIGHPIETDKFYDFVSATFYDDQIIDNNLLRKLLQEEFEVPEDLTNEIVCAYENAIMLLRHYKKFPALRADDTM